METNNIGHHSEYIVYLNLSHRRVLHQSFADKFVDRFHHQLMYCRPQSWNIIDLIEDVCLSVCLVQRKT